MYVLKQVSTNLDRHFIVSTTDHELCAEGDSIPADICGPWDALIRVEQTEDEVGTKLGLIANLIELSDLCLCDLSSTSLVTEIREYATREKGTFILDTRKPGANKGIQRLPMRKKKNRVDDLMSRLFEMEEL